MELFWTDVQVYRFFLNTNDLSFAVYTKNNLTPQFEILTFVGNQTKMKNEYPVLISRIKMFI